MAKDPITIAFVILLVAFAIQLNSWRLMRTSNVLVMQANQQLIHDNEVLIKMLRDRMTEHEHPDDVRPSMLRKL